MKPIFQLIILITVFIALPMSANPPVPSFLESSFWAAKTRAAKEHKSYLIIYNAAGCTPCEWMDTNVFSEPSVNAFINQNMVAATVDVYGEEGKRQRKIYNLSKIPTFIVFDEKGTEKGRLEDPTNPRGMLDFLKMYGQQKMNELPVISAVPDDYQQETITPLIPQESPVSPASPSVMSSPKPTVSTNSSGTFSIQIGAFSTKNSAYEVMGRLNDDYVTPATIYPEFKEGKKLYKVSIGVFHDRPTADDFKLKMLREGFVGAFVKVW